MAGQGSRGTQGRQADGPILDISDRSASPWTQPNTVRSEREKRRPPQIQVAPRLTSLLHSAAATCSRLVLMKEQPEEQRR